MTRPTNCMKNSRFIIEGYRWLWWLWRCGGWRVCPFILTRGVMSYTTAGEPDVFLSICRHAYQERVRHGAPHSWELGLQALSQHLLLARMVLVHNLCRSFHNEEIFKLCNRTGPHYEKLHSYWAAQEITCLLWNHEFHYRFTAPSLLVHILGINHFNAREISVSQGGEYVEGSLLWYSAV